MGERENMRVMSYQWIRTTNANRELEIRSLEITQKTNHKDSKGLTNLLECAFSQERCINSTIFPSQIQIGVNRTF